MRAEPFMCLCMKYIGTFVKDCRQLKRFMLPIGIGGGPAVFCVAL